MTTLWPNQGAAANRRPAGQLDGSGNFAAIVAIDRALPAAVAELGRMRHAAATHQRFLDVLESKSYEALRIMRYGRECCLIIRTGGKDHCFVSRDGERASYRHAWQIRDWLHERFGIDPDAVPVEAIKQ